MEDLIEHVPEFWRWGLPLDHRVAEPNEVLYSCKDISNPCGEGLSGQPTFETPAGLA